MEIGQIWFGQVRLTIVSTIPAGIGFLFFQEHVRDWMLATRLTIASCILVLQRYDLCTISDFTCVLEEVCCLIDDDRAFWSCFCRWFQRIVLCRSLGDQALQKEAAYFRDHPAYRGLDKRVGTSNLSKTLNQVCFLR